MSHIVVERNRRRMMNEHLKVLRSLTPCFYIKRGDQASIVGGAIEFIKELHQLVQSLESKKQRKLSLSPAATGHTTPTLSGGGPSPLLLLPPPPPPPPPPVDSPRSLFDAANLDLGVCCNSPVADVEAKIAGPNVILRALSKRRPGQVVRIIDVLERLDFEVIHLNISSMEDTVLYSFVIKIGLECQLSVEELASQVQQCFLQQDINVF